MDTDSTNKSEVRKRKAALNASFCVKKERNTIYQKVSTILQKAASERSKDEDEFLDNSQEIVEQITLRKAQRQKVKDRAQEYEDPEDVLSQKCKTLAEAVINSNHLVVYTGAGISTAACIPDYRGTNGIWTLLQQGKDIGLHDLSQAEPTLTHMALYCLYRSGVLKHIVSQNCDGLHLRSGIPRTILSEVHGNMYLEVCSKCKPSNHYLRLFDVTEYTGRYSHETLRLCYKCGSPLKDTIVHFGERGKLQWPLNWDTACKQADKADVILCLGSSLKVLKKYPWLWCMDKPAKKRPKLYIVNLQWTPKDDYSTLKINGKCDTVIEQMMSHIGLTIPQYVRTLDPIFYHATILHESEVHTTSRIPIDKNVPKRSVDCTLSQDLKDGEQSNGSAGDLETSVKMSTSTLAAETSPNDLTSVQIEDTPIDDKISLVNRSCDTAESSKNEELENSKFTSGLSANIKTESTSEECYDAKVFVKTDESNLNDSTRRSVVVKEETSVDASSDKENDEITNTKDECATEPKKSLTECDVEKMTVEEEEEEAKQSTVTVIQEKSSVETTVSEQIIEVKTEATTLTVDNRVSRNGDEGTTISNADAMLAFTSGLNLLCGRSLWSDLSVFDTLTNQPILFGRSMLGWSDMNAYAYNAKAAALTDLSNCAKNGDDCSQASSSTEQPKEKVCLFCLEYYCSRSCLFYTIGASNMPLDANSVCLCCGGDDEEEEQQQDEPDEDEDKTPTRVSNINPGWFGKGCRKRLKCKRR